MKLSYEDLISGDAIPVKGVGRLRSPYLKELWPSTGIGMWDYNFYLNILSWDKHDIIKFLSTTMSQKGFARLEDNDKISAYDVITLLDAPRMTLQKVMSFFMHEKISWDEHSKRFITSDEQHGKKIGSIDRENFEDVRDMMLQMNYVSIGNSAAPIKHSSEAAKKAWDKVQEHLKKQSTKPNSDKTLSMGNIISKLSAADTSYNLLNIYNLTVFQLYDQFFQYGFLRAMNLNEMAYSNHGGEKFDIQGWLKPIFKT